MKRRKMRRLERRKRKGAKTRFNELSAEPINANCGNAFREEDSCPETGWKPQPHFIKATEQLLGDNSFHMLLTWSRSKLMASLHSQLPKPLQVS